jgi:LuxR family maltose regulon positive regulatory protein
MVLVENAIALVENMRYEEAETCTKDALSIGSNINVFVDFFAYNELAQIYEETGRLNDSLVCYQQSRALLNTSSLMSWYGTNYYFGLVGVYMRQMQLNKANEILVSARHLLDAQRSRINITDMTLAHHEAEMEFLQGNDAAGAALVETLLAKYPSFNTLNIARLLHELACANRIPPALADKFLTELAAAKHYRQQPFMRLLRARLLFTQGAFAQALQETDEILTFSRLHANLLRLVEAGLQKVVLLAAQDSAAHAREIQNLLREAVHYALQNRILMPFYLDLRPLLPLLLQLARAGASKNEMTPAELEFLSEILALCGYVTPALQAPDELSARELQVLQQLALGITNREIAANLCISPATVKTHVLSIFGKLGVSSRMMAVEAGRTNGLLPLNYTT